VIIVDTSIAVKWALHEPERPEALQLLDLGVQFAAPDLIFAECANVFRKRCKSGEMSEEQALQAFTVLGTTLFKVIESRTLAKPAFEYAGRLDHSAYDCFFLAAVGEGDCLMTADQVFARKCRSGKIDGKPVFELGEIEKVRQFFRQEPAG